MSIEEHKKKEAEDTTLKVLVSKDSKEILEDIVLESLKTLFTDEIQRKTELTILDWFAMKKFYRLKAHCSSLNQMRSPYKKSSS